jgi:Outer membrane protein beta-barrel domain
VDLVITKLGFMLRFYYFILRNLHYLQIPVLLRVEKGFSDFRVWGNAGPYVGLFLGGKSKSVATTIGGFGGNQTFTDESDLKSGDDIKSVELGLMAGVGAGYKVGPGYITFDARYILGLTRTPPDNVTSTQTFNPDDFKNRSIMLSLGYMLEF